MLLCYFELPWLHTAANTRGPTITHTINAFMVITCTRTPLAIGMPINVPDTCSMGYTL